MRWCPFRNVFSQLYVVVVDVDDHVGSMFDVGWLWSSLLSLTSSPVLLCDIFLQWCSVKWCLLSNDYHNQSFSFESFDAGLMLMLMLMLILMTDYIITESYFIRDQMKILFPWTSMMMIMIIYQCRIGLSR